MLSKPPHKCFTFKIITKNKYQNYHKNKNKNVRAGRAGEFICRRMECNTFKEISKIRNKNLLSRNKICLLGIKFNTHSKSRQMPSVLHVHEVQVQVRN